MATTEKGKLSEEMHNKLNFEFPDTNLNLFTLWRLSSTFALDSNFLNIS